MPMIWAIMKIIVPGLQGYIWQLETISGFLLVNILKTGEI